MARKIISSIIPTEDNTQPVPQEPIIRTIVGSMTIAEETPEEEVEDIVLLRKVVSAISDPVSEAVVTPVNTLTPDPDDSILNLISELDEGENQTSSTGFSLSFTDDTIYDLDEIITNIKRDNSDIPLVMQVNFENTIVQEVTARIISELLILYSAESVDYILNFNNIFLQYFRDHFEEYAEEAKQVKTEGGMALDETHDKVKILRSDLKKYILTDEPDDRAVNPVTDSLKTLSLWYELGDGDLGDEVYDTGTFDQVVVNIVDGGSFLNDPIDIWDGGEF